jgi:hypothetical protein
MPSLDGDAGCEVCVSDLLGTERMSATVFVPGRAVKDGRRQ